MSKKSRLNRILLPINIFVVVLLQLSVAAKYVNPNTIGWLPFIGLAYPFLIVINLAFIGYWILRKQKLWWISLTAIILSWGTVRTFFQINFANDIPSNSLKVMSYNVRLFDLYNWTENKNTRNNMFKMLDEEKPDIACFQEFFYSSEAGYFNTLDTLVQFLKATHTHTMYNSSKHQVHHFGLATFSVYPIINKGKIDLKKDTPSNNDCIYTDMQIGKDTVRVYNFHLASIHFGREDYRFLEAIGEQETDAQIKGSKQILGRLKTAFQKRAKQAGIIADHIAQSPYPVIICGDMNDSPSSYAYNTISKNLQDVFVEKGNGTGTTYNGLFPAFRIDYILHNHSFKSLDYNTIKKPYSDHFPITAILEKTD